MKLHKATKFGLFAVLELARDSRRQLSATDIAGKYGISSHHLAKVLRDLGRAGLVHSVRGVGGGYRFVANARRTTLMDVISVFEDISSDNGQASEPCEGTDIGQALHLVLGEIDDIAQATLSAITIDTLLKTMRWQQNMETPPSNSLNY